MRARFVRPLVIVLMVGASLPTVALAVGPEVEPGTSVESSDLVERSGEFDGKTITYSGEVVGERMKRGSYAWIHANDDPYSERSIEAGQPLSGYNSGIAVWLPSDLTDGIRYYGDYTHQGDFVRVTGTFNAACPQHGGDLDIHATSLEVLRPGYLVYDRVQPEKAVVAAALAALAAVSFVAYRMGWGPRLGVRSRRTDGPA